MGEIVTISIQQEDGQITKLTHYLCSTSPKASLLILHGMAEHQKRYKDFAEFLTRQGYDVYTYDHRGHGSDIKLCDLGFIAFDNGYELLIQDAIKVSKYINENNRCNKFFLFGHSMGSIIVRNVIQTYDAYQGIILSGSNFPPKLLVYLGLLLSGLIKKFKGPKHISPFLSSLLFGSKKYTSLSTRTVFDWLSRSNPVVGAYMHDPYCGFTCTASFYHDLLKLNQYAISLKLIQGTRKNLPTLIIGGEKDPVSSYGKELHKLNNTYKKLEFKDFKLQLYPNCRHELLNELNKDEVYTYINAWLETKI